MSRIIFGILISAFFIGISYFNTKIYSYGLKLNLFQEKLLFLVFLIIPLLFTLSMALGFKGLLPSFLHRIIQTLSGFGLYVFFGTLILGFIYSLGFIFKINIPESIPYLILILSLSLSTIGFIQARFIKVVDYTLKNEKIPESLIGKKAILVSDTHFGVINHKNFSDKIVKKIISLNPDFVLHAGDFYDGPKNDTKPITESWKKLTEKFPVFMAPGNHEEYGDYRGFLDSISNAGVMVLEDKKTTYNDFDIVGIKYRENRGENNKVNLALVDNVLKSLNIDENN